MNNCKQYQINDGASVVPRTCPECKLGPCKYGIEPLPTHVDEFINDLDTDRYASWFFSLHRLPAILQSKFAKWMDQYQLYCTYEGRRYRVTGCSRMGDVWLHSDYKATYGYEHRVNVDSCTDFSST